MSATMTAAPWAWSRTARKTHHVASCGVRYDGAPKRLRAFHSSGTTRPERQRGGTPSRVAKTREGAGQLDKASLYLHAPPLHVLPRVQTVPQAPQFPLSLLTSTHTPLPAQSGRFVGHVHAPSVQVAPAWQALPHAPQFFGSEVVSVQTPLQSWAGRAQEHEAPEQVFPPVQEIPHEPQFSAFVCVSTQLLTQLVRFGSQVEAQRPAVHT